MATGQLKPQTPGSSDDLKHVLDTARDALDHEFQLAERYDAKARGRATLAGSWFAATQAVTAVALKFNDASAWLLVATGVCVFFMVLSLVALLQASARVWRL